MKKAIVALTVFAFVFAFSGNSLMAMTGNSASYSIVFNDDKDPKADGTKKAAKADKKSSSSCSSSCSDKSAKASGDCGPKKATTAEATPSSDKK